MACPVEISVNHSSVPCTSRCINPIFAALSGTVVLSQVLELHEWEGMVLIVATNAAAIWVA